MSLAAALVASPSCSSDDEIDVTNLGGAAASEEGGDRETETEADDGESQSTESTATVAVVAPTNSALEEFKKDVKIWMDLDNAVKKLKAMAKDKVKTQKQLTEKIMAFMAKYNIEDLNTRDGKLRYKIRQVKAPAPRRNIIKERLEVCLKGNPDLYRHVMQNVFKEDCVTSGDKPPVVQKPCLKRLKGSRKSMTVG